MTPQLDITVLFSTTRKVMSRVIRWITRAPCSHASICFYDATLDARLVLQAEWWGFEARPRARWSKENIRIAEYEPIGLDLISPLRQTAASLGASYDYRSAVLVGLLGWLRRWYRARFSLRPSRTPSKLMCSEAVVRFLQLAGARGVRHLDAETTSPGELLTCVRASPDFERRN